MANYYTQFSVGLDNIPEEDYPYLRGLVKRVEAAQGPLYEEEDWLSFECKLDEENGQLWIYSDEDGDPSDAADEIQKYLKECQPGWKVELYWANTCSKPLPGGFDGGACLITADEIFWFSLREMLKQKLDELYGEPKVMGEPLNLSDDSDAAEIGNKLMDLLSLKRMKSGRVNTTWGDKTSAGLARSVQRLFFEKDLEG